MLVSELLPKAHLVATGKVNKLVSNDKNWTKLLQISNILLQTWATEPSADWQSLYEDIDIGTITATDTFDLDSTIQRVSNKPGDFIKIVKGDQTFKFDLVPASELSRSGDQACSRYGSAIKFNKTFKSTDSEFGGALLIPSYTYPATLTSGNQRVPMDDPNWLVFMVAAEWVRNDLTLAQNYPNLIALANNTMSGMKIANMSQSSQAFRVPVMRNVRSW